MNRMNMMEQVHLAGEDEDDIYGGFNDYNATLDVDVRNVQGWIFLQMYLHIFKMLFLKFEPCSGNLIQDHGLFATVVTA